MKNVLAVIRPTAYNINDFNKKFGSNSNFQGFTSSRSYFITQTPYYLSINSVIIK